MTHRTLPRALSLALAFAVASFGALLAPGHAEAAKPKEPASETQPPAKDAASAETKPKGKAQRAPKTKVKKSAGTKARASRKAAAKPGKATPKPAKAKRSASRENKAAGKRAKPQPKADDSPVQGAKGAEPCTGAAISFDRGGVEGQRFPLVDCQQKPLDSAVTKVSALARPWGAPRSAASAAVRLDPGVITRLHAIAKKIPGRTLSIVGGPQPSAGGSSAHTSGRAVDLRVEGVDNQKLIEICRSLPDTGCGYYPNASFIHLDVRASGAGKVFWIDAAEPGEPPRYVTSWPPAAGASNASEK